MAATRERTDHDLTLEAIPTRGWRAVLLGEQRKIPTGATWQITDDVARIGRHLDAGANIGLVAGEETGVAIFDDDQLDLFREMEATLGALGRPWVQTGSGKLHSYVAWEEGLPAVLEWQGRRVGEIKRGGSRTEPRQEQAVMPPSLHPDGPPYVWLVDPRTEPLIVLPDAWRRHLLGRSVAPTTFTLPDKVRQGARNDTAYRLVRSLKAKGLSLSAVSAALDAENVARFDPPLDGTELLGLLQHAWEQPDRAAFRAATSNGHRPADPTADFPQAKLLRGREITEVQVPEPDWTIERAFSHAHQHMLASASQGAKSWTLFDLGLAIASPTVTHFLGQPVLRHGVAVIESWEQGQQEDLRKMQKLIAGRGLGAGPDNLILLSDAPDSLNAEAYFARRLQDLKDWGAVAYLIDSLSEGAGIELNDNTLYSEWWRARIKPILDLGCMVVFTHLRGHRKPGIGQDRDSASRGATQIRALSTGVIEMRQITDTTFQVKHNKHRNGTALPFGTLELEGKPEDPFVRLALTTGTVLTAEGKAVLARQLLSDLGRSKPGVWLTRPAIEAAVNDQDKPRSERVSKKTWEPVLAEMTAEGGFEKAKKGNADAWRWVGTDSRDDDED